MKWFKPKYSVCKECSVHFEPAPSCDAQWADLCPTHRKPVKERDQLKEAVINWASAHWERLVPMMEEERAKADAEHRISMHKYYNSLGQAAAQQQNQLANNLGSVQGLRSGKP